MNFPYFIASRIRKPPQGSFSATVHRIGVASIAIGLAVMIVAFMVFLGFKSTVKQKIFSLSGHIQVKPFSKNTSIDDTGFEQLSTEKRANFPAEITHIQAVALKTGLLKTNNGLQGVLMKGVGKDYDWEGFSLNLIAGKTLILSDTAMSNGIIVSKKIADKLLLSVGDGLTVAFLQNPPRFRKLTVVGIYETGIEEIDEQMVLGDLSLVQKMNNWEKNTIGRYEVFVENTDFLLQSTQNLSKVLPQELAVESVEAQFMGVFTWLQLLDRNVLVFLVLILLVACFNMVSVLLVMMMERTPMVGLFKALGAASWQIRQVFVYQGITIILWGLFWGNVLGLGLCWLQKTFQLIPLNPEQYYMNHVPIEWHFEVIIYLNITTLLLVTLVLLLPTVVINKIQPIKAIQFTK